MDNYKPESVEDILEKNRLYVELMSRVNNSFVWILERTTGVYLYLSPNIADILECDSSELRKRQSLEFLFRYIHPDDLAVLTAVQNRFFDFVINLPYEERMYYKHIFEFRVRHKGSWVRVTDQRQLLGIASDNKIVVLGIVDISPNQTAGQAVNCKLVNFRTGDIVPLMPDKVSDSTLTAFRADMDTYKTTDVKRILERNRPFIELLVQMNNSCVYVLERKRNTFLYMSPNFSDFWEYESLELTKRKPKEYLVRHIHSDDIATFRDIQNRILKFIGTLPNEEQLDYKYIFELRALHKGIWTRIISQHQLLGITSDGTPILLGVVDISPNQTSAQTVSFRLVNNKTGEIIAFPFYENAISNSLSRRELEILKMVGEGMLSKEISEKLSISIHTVNGHRQKILQKMDVQNLTEAINLARKLGLLA
jgi:DNA-binding CsgD family transcriptional regulator/PAS domain-containing protein